MLHIIQTNIYFKIYYSEIIGYVDEIDGPKIVGKAQQYKLLKFMVNNNSRHRIQVVAWNNEIERIQFHLKPNRVIKELCFSFYLLKIELF